MPTSMLVISNASGYTTVNPSYAIVDDGNYAQYTASSPGTNSYLRFGTNAASVIPANAIILGVRCGVKSYVSDTIPRPKLIFGPGSFGQTPKNQTWVYPTTSAAWYFFGSLTDDMGSTKFEGSYPLTNCSIRFTTENDGTADIYVDSVTMEVSWKLPDLTDCLFFGGGF